MLWTFDDGELTDRSQLPVTKLNFGNFYEVRLERKNDEKGTGGGSWFSLSWLSTKLKFLVLLRELQSAMKRG
jgi:hypothetical protein